MTLRPGRTVVPFVVVCLLTAIVSAGCGYLGEDDSPLATPPEADIAYGPNAGCDGPDKDCGGSQTLDIYRSTKPGPNPVIVFFHGGGFVSGDKEESLSKHLQAALDDGWDLVSANYRLTTPDGSNQFPAAVNDAKRVVRWVRANAEEQDWDPDNVAAMGNSSGGNLAAMLAVTADEPELEDPDLPPELAAEPSSVIAAIALNPVTDLTLFGANPEWTQAMQHYTGCTQDCTSAFQQGSVQIHVDPASSPILAVFGSKDEIAAPVQGVLVQDQYESNGIGDRFTLIIVDSGPEQYLKHETDYERFTSRFLEFLDSNRV